jgi:hypothetical protein
VCTVRAVVERFTRHLRLCCRCWIDSPPSSSAAWRRCPPSRRSTRPPVGLGQLGYHYEVWSLRRFAPVKRHAIVLCFLRAALVETTDAVVEVQDKLITGVHNKARRGGRRFCAPLKKRAAEWSRRWKRWLKTAKDPVMGRIRSAVVKSESREDKAVWDVCALKLKGLKKRGIGTNLFFSS